MSKSEVVVGYDPTYQMSGEPFQPNEAGFEPLEYKVLIKVDHVDDKIGNIYIPEKERERNQHATVNGTVIAVGDMACEEFPDRQKLNPGDRVAIKKWGGEIIEIGGDKEHWRVVQDKEVLGRWM